MHKVHVGIIGIILQVIINSLRVLSVPTGLTDYLDSNLKAATYILAAGTGNSVDVKPTGTCWTVKALFFTVGCLKSHRNS